MKDTAEVYGLVLRMPQARERIKVWTKTWIRFKIIVIWGSLGIHIIFQHFQF